MFRSRYSEVQMNSCVNLVSSIVDANFLLRNAIIIITIEKHVDCQERKNENFPNTSAKICNSGHLPNRVRASNRQKK